MEQSHHEVGIKRIPTGIINYLGISTAEAWITPALPVQDVPKPIHTLRFHL